MGALTRHFHHPQESRLVPHFLPWPSVLRLDTMRALPSPACMHHRLCPCPAALRKEWASIEELCAQDPSRFPPERFTFDSFLRSFCVVLAHSTFLPSAECFALVPLLGWAKKTCEGCEDVCQNWCRLLQTGQANVTECLHLTVFRMPCFLSVSDACTAAPSFHPWCPCPQVLLAHVGWTTTPNAAR